MQNEGLSLKVAFNSIYQTSSNSVTPDAVDRPRSARRSLSFKKAQDPGASQVEWSAKDDLIFVGTRRPASSKYRQLKVRIYLSIMFI